MLTRSKPPSTVLLLHLTANAKLFAQVRRLSSMPRLRLPLLAIVCLALVVTGCPKGNQEAKQGQKAEELQDYDAALVHYQRALREEPTKTEYKLKTARLRFEAANFHVSQGEKLRDKGDMQGALAEFQKAAAIDPANSLAAQEAQHLLELIGARAAAETAPALLPAPEPKLMEGPPKLTPLSPFPKNFKMTNDPKTIFQTIGQLAGLTVVFDPDFGSTPGPSHRITVDLPNVTYQEALNIAALESKAFWKPITGNIIFVANDDPAKRKQYDEEIVRVFYLSNVTVDKDLTEIVAAIRTLFTPALAKINVVSAQNAIVVRDTPDKVMLVGKLINALDKAKSEVVVQVSIAEVNLDVSRDLGVTPGTSASITFSPPSASTSTSSTTAASSGVAATATLALNQLKHISSADYQVSLPSASVNAMLSDSTTRILQNPEIRSVDGQKADLKVGTRIPVATGSFQAGIGAGTTGTSSLVSPLVNTQFAYQDVGVNVDLTPRILPNRDVAMHIKVEVSTVAGNVNIGGINEPEIGQNIIEHDVRLKDGETSVLGGIVQKTNNVAISGYPGLAKIPLLGYLFGDHSTTNNDDELLIVLTPHVVRMPDITADDLRSIATGTDANTEVRLADDSAEVPPASPQTQQQTQATSLPQPAQQPVPVIATAPPPGTQPATVPVTNGPANLRFDSPNITLNRGETATVGIVVENVKDLSSIPLLLQYNPAVISVEEVRHGGFLSGDSQEAIVQNINQQHGQAIISATRPPNTPGVSGTGTVVAVVIKALASGNSQLSIVQVNAKDSQQRPIPLLTNEGTVHVR